MDELYTVVYCSEDGSHSIEVMGKQILEERLNDKEYWGPKCKVLAVNDERVDLDATFGLFIIKGVPIQPKAEAQVTKWSV